MDFILFQCWKRVAMGKKIKIIVSSLSEKHIAFMHVWLMCLKYAYMQIRYTLRSGLKYCIFMLFSANVKIIKSRTHKHSNLTWLEKLMSHGVLRCKCMCICAQFRWKLTLNEGKVDYAFIHIRLHIFIYIYTCCIFCKIFSSTFFQKFLITEDLAKTLHRCIYTYIYVWYMHAL